MQWYQDQMINYQYKCLVMDNFHLDENDLFKFPLFLATSRLKCRQKSAFSQNAYITCILISGNCVAFLYRLCKLLLATFL